MRAHEWMERLMPRSGRAFVLGVSLALAVLGLTILAGWLLVRSLVRQQIAQRDAEALHATTLMEQLDARNGAEADALGNDQQIGFDAAVRASRLKGVIGIRFFDSTGRFTDAFPATIQPAQLSGAALEAVSRLQPYSRYSPNTPLSDVFIYLPQFATGNVPHVGTLRVTVPLHRRDSTNLAGAAQFIVEGESIAHEYARLDRRLGGLAAAAFAVGGLLLVTMLWPAFRQVGRLNRELAERNQRLARANQELALAARASALGAISAHLMHGLKNPLASLSHFVNHQGNRDAGPKDEEAQDALTAARRMQSLVDQTLEVLADARGEPAYEVAVTEMLENVRCRVEPIACKLKVSLDIAAKGDYLLSSRTANLLTLMLVNLLENAVQVTPPAGRVSLKSNVHSDHLSLRVQDQGTGFPEHLRSSLFLPCRSSRDGGSGLGLAISKQLAEHLGATLELSESTSEGCTFTLDVPLNREGEAASAAPGRVGGAAR